MKFLLSEESLKWQEKAHRFAEEMIRPAAPKFDRAQEYPWEIKEAMAKEGFFGVWIPREYGGAGGGVMDLCVVVEEFSRACAGVGIMYAVNALGTLPILIAGTEEQKKNYLPPMAAGEKLAAFSLSEKVAGSDVGGMQTRAVKEGGEYVLNGEKKWTTNGKAADIYTVFAVTDPESKSRRISAFIVEKGTAGFEFIKEEDKLGIRCVPVVELSFDDCRVPEENLLGGKPGLGFKHAMMTLDRGRPGVAAQAVGLAQGAFEYALIYSRRRVQFGTPVWSFQMIQQMLAGMATKIDAARLLVHACAKAVDGGQPQAGRLAAEAKSFATDVAMEVASDAVQVFGGYGYMKDYPIEKYLRDAKITQIYEGTNQIQRVVIARALMREASEYDFLEKFIPVERQKGVEEGSEAKVK